MLASHAQQEHMLLIPLLQVAQIAQKDAYPAQVQINAQVAQQVTKKNAEMLSTLLTFKYQIFASE